MRRPPPIDPAEVARELLRIGARRFAVRFATRHRVDGLPPGQAATVALRELAHETIGGILGLPRLAPDARKPRGPVRDPRPTRNRPGARKRDANRGGLKADPDLERFEKLKKFVLGTGEHPDKGRKTPT